MVGVRPTQARSLQRHEALLRAAIELLAEGGAKAVTHRAVAARAGVPAATTTYYFESIQDLTDQALCRHVDNRVRELEELGAAVMVPGASLNQVAWGFAEALAAGSKLGAIAQYEVCLEAARSPVLHPSVERALAAFERLAEDTLTALGARRPSEAAHALVALIDGFMLHRLVRPDAGAGPLFDAMRALLVTQLVDDETVDALLARFDERLVP